MARKYGDEQREEVRRIRESLINELEEVYLKKFEQINKSGLGSGFIAKLTQLLLLSRDGAISELSRAIESKDDPTPEKLSSAS